MCCLVGASCQTVKCKDEDEEEAEETYGTLGRASSPVWQWKLLQPVSVFGLGCHFQTALGVVSDK